MSAQLDEFCAWARPCNGTYLNEQAFNALAVWKAAQAAMQAELAQLRGFAVDVMGAWPDGDIDGSDLQDMAVEHGLLTAATVHQPCAGPCSCVDYVSDEQFDAGVECYRKSQVLLDAEIARTGSAA